METENVYVDKRSADGSAFKLKFKMFMEGRVAPLKSAVIKCTPSGVECNLVLNSTDKIFDLLPKTFVQVFYHDWFGAESQKAWRLMGEGYFSGFSKSDDAAGQRSVSIICRDFRMDVRKTPAAMMYMPDKAFTRSHLFQQSGLKQNMIIYNKKGVAKKVNVVRRSFGGKLNNYYQTLNIIAGTAVGEVNSAKNISYKGGSWGDGRYFLDAFVRGLWIESVAGTNYGNFVNSRIRLDKRMYIPDNEAGYTFFNKDFLNTFGGSAVSGNSIFTSVEATMMRVAAIFQATPHSCSTPTLIDAKDAMSEKMYDFLVVKNDTKFGAPYVMNSCMILPSMSFTAPPNCNILFPCMYSKLNWQHDYDKDVTRGYYKHIHVFGNSNPGGDFGTGASEVPNSLFDKGTTGRDNPPITIEERFKGVNIKYGSVEWKVASANRSKSWAKKAILEYDSYGNQVLKLKSKRNKQIEKRRAELYSQGVYTDEGAKKIATEEAQKKFLIEKKKITVARDTRPSVNDVMDRHAVLKFLHSRYMARSVVIDGDFNPYPVCGFPGIVMADDQRDQFKTLRTLIGMVRIVKHTINAESGEASTSIMMNNARFLSEPTDINNLGQKLYLKDTDPKLAKVDSETLQYVTKNYLPPEGKPEKLMKNVMRSDPNYDWKISDRKDGAPTWAKDILLISLEGLQKGKSNLSFMDETYMPNKIMTFYEKLFRQPAKGHFMVGEFHDKEKDEDYHYIYDSVHEAATNLQNNEKGLMNDYESALAYVRRDVISEEQYFLGILGASYIHYEVVEAEGKPNKTVVTYESKRTRDAFDLKADRDEYFGIPTFDVAFLPEGLDLKEGEFSSITEKKPLTAFNRERRVAVDNYLDEVTKNVNSTR